MKKDFSLSYFAYRNMKMDTFEKMVEKYEKIYIQDKGTIEEYFSKQYALEPDEIQKMNSFFSMKKEKLQKEIVLHSIQHANIHIFEVIQKENMFFDFWKENKTVVGHVLSYYVIAKEEVRGRLKEILAILLSMKADVSAIYRMNEMTCNILVLIQVHGLYEIMPILETYKEHFPEEFRKEFQAFRLKRVFK